MEKDFDTVERQFGHGHHFYLSVHIICDMPPPSLVRGRSTLPLIPSVFLFLNGSGSTVWDPLHQRYQRCPTDPIINCQSTFVLPFPNGAEKRKVPTAEWTSPNPCPGRTTNQTVIVSCSVIISGFK